MTHPTTPDQGDERRANRIEELAAKYSSLDDYGQTVFPEGQWEMFVADLATEPATTREFTNELGNAIRITIEGPTSTSENILTPMEVGQLRGALNEHGTLSLDEAYERCGWAKPKTAPMPPLPEPRDLDGARWGYDADDMNNYGVDCFNAALAVPQGEGGGHG